MQESGLNWISASFFRENWMLNLVKRMERNPDFFSLIEKYVDICISIYKDDI